MIAGMIPALILPLTMKLIVAELPSQWALLGEPLYYFPIILLFSVIGCLWGTYSAPPTEVETLKNFYKKTRPWGFWAPINTRVEAEDPDFRKNKNFGRDVLNVVTGIIWQTCLVATCLFSMQRVHVCRHRFDDRHRNIRCPVHELVQKTKL
jgi:hypothetical protein